MKNIKLRLLPTILFTAFVMLIVRAHSYSMDFYNMPDIPIDSNTELWDVFCYIKSQAIFAIAIYAAITMAYLLLVGRIKIKKTFIYVPMVAYAVLVVFSYVFSDYKWLSFYGSVNRFEGTRTILCYLFMLFYTINVVDEFRDALVVVVSSVVSTLIACLIGITQLLGADIFLSDIAEKIVTGSDVLAINPNFRSGQVYQSVANMNYVGMYLALIIPILAYAIYWLCKKQNRLILTEHGIYNEKRWVIIIALGGLLLLIILNLFGASSLGGVFGIATALFILILVNVSNKEWRVSIIAGFISGFIVILTFVYMFGVDDHNITGHKQIDYIETGIDCVNMSIDGNKISITYDREVGGYELFDGDNEPIHIFWYADQEDVIQVDDDRFCGRVELVPLQFENGEASIIVVVRDIDFESFGFTFYEDGAKYLNPYYQEVALKKIDSLGFTGHLSAGSGRGYIWSRTLPLLRGRLLIGSGADTFLVVFPQNDYAGKYSSGTPLNITFDKPHNMYLGMAVGTGLLSMVAFLAMAVMALLKAFSVSEDKKYIKVLAAGIVGFLVAGLFNDSTVCIMPMFYGLLGTVVGLCE